MEERSRFAAIRRKMMPKGIDLARRAQDELTARYKAKNIDPFGRAYLKAHCDKILDELIALEFELFKMEEQRVNSDLLWQVVGNALPLSKPLTKSQLEPLVKGKFNELRDFYKHLRGAQGARPARGRCGCGPGRGGCKTAPGRGR